MKNMPLAETAKRIYGPVMIYEDTEGNNMKMPMKQKAPMPKPVKGKGKKGC